MADDFQKKFNDMKGELLRDLDAFYDDWYNRVKQELLPQEGEDLDSADFVQRLMKDYALGNIEEIPGLPVIRFCPRCKARPVDLEWMDYEEEHFIENGQEFLKQGGSCKCKDHDDWIVTYKLLPIKMEER